MKRSSKLPVLRHYRALFESGSFCGLSDGELLSRFVSRDGESAELAFAVLVERHASGVLRICKAIAGNENDGEDAFQATFLVLATKAGRLIVRESLGPWLASVARRISRRARAAALARAVRETRAAELAGMRTNQIADDDDRASVLHEEIDRLPERYRLPLLLCDLESQSHQEAARTLGWPLGTVKSRQARARQRLRARLSRRGLSGLLPTAYAFRSARSSVPDSLIQATAKAAVILVSPTTAAQAVSATVSTLVTNTLRAMIMTRLSLLLAVLLTISAGIAATVVAQTFPDQNKPLTAGAPRHSADRTPAPASAPVFEYEIRIWKDGVPITPTMKMRARPGETSQLKIPEGTVDLRFERQVDHLEASTASQRQSAANTPQEPLRAEAHQLLGQALAGAANQQVQDLNPSLRALVNEHAKGTVNNQLLQAIANSGNDPRVDDLHDLAKVLHQNRENAANQDQRAKQGHETALGLALSRASGENKDHEKRLAEIERKLERILSVLDRLPAKSPGATNKSSSN